MAMILHSEALTLPCSATFADAQTFVHHHAMTVVNGKTTFFKGFMARFVGENATITCFEVKDNGHAFNPVMECGQLLVRALTTEDMNCLRADDPAMIFGVI